MLATSGKAMAVTSAIHIGCLYGLRSGRRTGERSVEPSNLGRLDVPYRSMLLKKLCRRTTFLQKCEDGVAQASLFRIRNHYPRRVVTAIPYKTLQLASPSIWKSTYGWMRRRR